MKIYVSTLTMLFLVFLCFEINGETQKPKEVDGFFQYQHSFYKGLKISISKESMRDLKLMFDSDIELYEKEYKIDLLSSDEIYAELDKRITEMAEQFNSHLALGDENAKLPDCISVSFACLLKLLESGEMEFEIQWELTHCKNYHDFYYQDREDKILRTTNCSGWANSKSMGLSDLFRQKCLNREDPPSDYKKMISTPSAFFHEIVHRLKRIFPWCFQSYTRCWEEVTTEDGTRLVFGREHTLDCYERINLCGKKFWNDCTEENICKENCCKDCDDVIWK